MTAVSEGWLAGRRNAITDVPGIRVGHWTDPRRATGCTVILCEGAAGAAVDTRGGAPGTRETDLLGPAMTVQSAHAIVFAGGSAFGLAAAEGVMRYLAERDVGFKTRQRNIPIVPAAIIYDLDVGSSTAYPDAAAGYLAAKRAAGGSVPQGSVGAGTGATVAKLLGPEHMLKGGVGTASVLGPRGFVVGALAAVNAVGCVFDPETGEMVAGPRDGPATFVPLPEALTRRTREIDAEASQAALQNTTLVCVATNAAVDHRALQRLAMVAHDGLARSIYPAHTSGDGDVSFAVSTGSVESKPYDTVALGAMTVRAVELAILSAVRLAAPLGGVPSAASWVDSR